MDNSLSMQKASQSSAEERERHTHTRSTCFLLVQIKTGGREEKSCVIQSKLWRRSQQADFLFHAGHRIQSRTIPHFWTVMIGGRSLSLFGSGGGLSAPRTGSSGSQGREGALVWARHYGGRGWGLGWGRHVCFAALDLQYSHLTTRGHSRPPGSEWGGLTSKWGAIKTLLSAGKRVICMCVCSGSLWLLFFGHDAEKLRFSQSRRKAGRQGRSSPSSSSFPLWTPTAKKSIRPPPWDKSYNLDFMSVNSFNGTQDCPDPALFFPLHSFFVFVSPRRRKGGRSSSFKTF